MEHGYEAYMPSISGPSQGSHQSCSLTVLSSRYMVLDKKSIPMVACNHIVTFRLD